MLEDSTDAFAADGLDGAELRALYQEVLLHHSRNPRNFGGLSGACMEAHGHNPLCGDRIEVQVRLDDKQTISEIGFSGSGCAISVASASLMTEAVRTLDCESVRGLVQSFTALCRSAEEAQAHPLPPNYEDLQVFAGVRAFPMRVKCATLAWHALLAAFAGDGQASTE